MELRLHRPLMSYYLACVLGKEEKEITTIEQSAVATTARRSTVLRISPSHP
jgi:hypothetical protein